MRFVPVKTREQQSILVLHRIRALLVRQRTASVNCERGLLGEFGCVVSKGMRESDELRRRMDKSGPELLPDEARVAIGCLLDHIDGLAERVAAGEERILVWHKSNQVSQRLASAPGVGPKTATALVAAVGDGKQLQSARHAAAWLGLTPRIKASGGKERIGRISKGVDRYFGHPPDPRCAGSRGYHVPQGCGASAMADGLDRPAARERRRDSGGA